MRVNSTVTDETVIYVYDDSGNILRKVIYDYTTADTPTGSSQTIYYTYDTTWKDKLAAYDGKEISYDAIGNPTSYDGKSFTWNGRRMATFSDGTTTSSYKYNEDGVRTSKTVGDTTTYFFVDGTTILAQRKGNTQNAFFYDANGKRIAFRHGGLIYYYVYNLQGDVTHILNESGNIVGTYEYDAWGQITNLDSLTAVAKVNPFRYRGYYYDTESGLYYLNSRYYNPEWGRFINTDDVSLLGVNGDFSSYNLFAYCGNNPITRADDGGGYWNVVIGAIVGGAVSLVSSVIAESLDGKIVLKDIAKIAISTTIGAIEGAAMALCPSASAIISSVSSVADTVIGGLIDGDDLGEIAINSVVSGTIGAMAGSGGSDFAKGEKAINNAVSSIKNVVKKGIHPTVRKAAKKTIKKVAKKIGKTYLSNQIEDFAYTGIYVFSAFCSNSIADKYWSR